MGRKEELLRKFGKRLTRLRKQKGLSVRELAIASRLETSKVQRIEDGEINLLFTTILALSRGLEMAPVELLRGL